LEIKADPDTLRVMETAEIESRIAKALGTFPEVTFAYLFGSRARGDARPDSDVDVAISVLEGENTGRLWLMAMGALEQALAPLKVDCILLNDAPPGLRFSVVRDGRIVLDRATDARMEFEVSTRRQYWDWEPRRRLHDEALLKRLRDGTYGTQPRDSRPLASR